MVEKTRDVLVAGIAVARGVARWPRHELEAALCIKGMTYRWRGEGTVHVEIVVAVAAFVARPYPNLLAPVALERHLCALQLELVLWVPHMCYFYIPHSLLNFTLASLDQTDSNCISLVRFICHILEWELGLQGEAEEGFMLFLMHRGREFWVVTC